MLMDAVLLLFLFSPAFWPKLSIMDSTIKNCNSVQPSRIQTRTGESPNNEGTASHQLLSLPLEEQYIQAVLFSFSLLLHLTLQPSNSLLAINSLKNLRHIFSTRLFGDNYCFITAAQAPNILQKHVRCLERGADVLSTVPSLTHTESCGGWCLRNSSAEICRSCSGWRHEYSSTEQESGWNSLQLYQQIPGVFQFFGNRPNCFQLSVFLSAYWMQQLVTWKF